jgi:hypothetical protein
MFEDNSMNRRSNVTTTKNIGRIDSPRLKVTDPRVYPSKNVLKEEFRILSTRYYKEMGEISNIDSSNYKLVDSD